MFDTYGADAMRWFLLSSPILRGGDLVVTEHGHPRRRAPGAAAAVERVVLLHALRQRRRLRRRGAAPTQTDVLDRYVLAKTARPRRRRHRGDGRLRPLRRVRRGAGASSTRSPTGTSAAAATASGPATPDAFDTLLHGAGTCCAGSPRRCCRSSPRTIYRGPDRRAQRAPHRLARRRRRCRPTPELVAAMDRVRDVCSAALSRPQGATACGCACRWPSLTVAAPDAPTPSRRSPTSSPTRSTSRTSGSPTTSAPVGRIESCRSCRRSLGPRLGADVQTVIRAVQGRRLDAATATRSSPAASTLARRRVHAAARRRRRRPRAPRCPAATASSCSTPTSPPSWRPRAWPATWCDWCSRPAATPGWHVSDRIDLARRAARRRGASPAGARTRRFDRRRDASPPRSTWVDRRRRHRRSTCVAGQPAAIASPVPASAVAGRYGDAVRSRGGAIATAGPTAYRSARSPTGLDRRRRHWPTTADRTPPAQRRRPTPPAKKRRGQGRRPAQGRRPQTRHEGRRPRSRGAGQEGAGQEGRGAAKKAAGQGRGGQEGRRADQGAGRQGRRPRRPKAAVDAVRRQVPRRPSASCCSTSGPSCSVRPSASRTRPPR